jgi:DNA repair exonuclease SbcCD ATPase subunit
MTLPDDQRPPRGWTVGDIRELQITISELKEDTESLERCYARAIHRIAELEKTLDAVRAECNRLLEEKREFARTIDNLMVQGVTLGN